MTELHEEPRLSPRARPARSKHRKPSGPTGPERRRARQLLACLLIFALVLIGRGAPSGRLYALGEMMSSWVHEQMDFRATFASLGKAFSEGEAFLPTIGKLWEGVFGPGEQPNENPPTPPETVPGEQSESGPPAEGDAVMQPPTEGAGEEASPPTDGATAPAGAEPAAAASAPDPSSAALLDEETVTPVMGVLTSPFGYREHPIDGEWKQHDGMDIMANEGTPIRAFAAGEVDYIGQSPSYGLYLQIKHTNEVRSFYAHCSKLLVKKGDKISVGQEVALVGSTGDVTGAHLHLELKKDGARIDPAPYVQTKSP